ncbi:hypothetical protein [Pseudomonas chlororaphis]|nr:hypothetical protein [Pseudomonas chlororaphis]
MSSHTHRLFLVTSRLTIRRRQSYHRPRYLSQRRSATPELSVVRSATK